MKRLEDYIQFQICQYLRSVGIFFFHVPNGAKRSATEASRLKALGIVSGIPDLVLCFPKGRTVFIELKTEKGRKSETQYLVHDRLSKMEFPVLTIQTDCHLEAVRLVQEIVQKYSV